MRVLQAACESKVHEIFAAIKAQVATSDGGRPNETVRKLERELEELRATLSSEIRRIQESAGISEAEIEAVERAYEADRTPSGCDFWQRLVRGPAAKKQNEITFVEIRMKEDRGFYAGELKSYGILRDSERNKDFYIINAYRKKSSTDQFTKLNADDVLLNFGDVESMQVIRRNYPR